MPRSKNSLLWTGGLAPTSVDVAGGVRARWRSGIAVHVRHATLDDDREVAGGPIRMPMLRIRATPPDPRGVAPGYPKPDQMNHEGRHGHFTIPPVEGFGLPRPEDQSAPESLRLEQRIPGPDPLEIEDGVTATDDEDIRLHEDPRSVLHEDERLHRNIDDHRLRKDGLLRVVEPAELVALPGRLRRRLLLRRTASDQDEQEQRNRQTGHGDPPPLLRGVMGMRDFCAQITNELSKSESKPEARNSP